MRREVAAFLTLLVCLVIGISLATLIGNLFPETVFGLVCRAVVAFVFGLLSAWTAYAIAERNRWL